MEIYSAISMALTSSGAGNDIGTIPSGTGATLTSAPFVMMRASHRLGID